MINSECPRGILIAIKLQRYNYNCVTPICRMKFLIHRIIIIASQLSALIRRFAEVAKRW